MEDILLSNELAFRTGGFFTMFLLVAFWEVLAPRRVLTASKIVRWINNLGLSLFNSLVLYLGFPVLAVGFAAICVKNGWGLFNALNLPEGLKILLSVLLLDLLIYLQHVVFHKFQILWRLHRMHHIDPDLDVTSGTRFHTFEIVLSMLIKMLAIILMGAPPAAVLLFELFLNLSAMFNHGNILIPAKLDNALRIFLVTPDMHRIHHSTLREETDSNFGFFLSWWDRLFKTYRKTPEQGHLGMTLGIGAFTEPKFLTIQWLLRIPFLNPKKD